MDADYLRRLQLRPPADDLRSRILAAAGNRLVPARRWWQRPGPRFASIAVLLVAVAGTMVFQARQPTASPTPVLVPVALPEVHIAFPQAPDPPSVLATPVAAGSDDASGPADYQHFDARAMYGVNMTAPTSGTQQREGLEPSQGVEVTAVLPGSAAERSGIRVGDVLLAINGAELASMTDLRNEIALAGVGGEIEVVISRDGSQRSLRAVLGEWPADIPYQSIDAAAEERFRAWQRHRLDRIETAVQALRRQIEGLERPQRAWRVSGQVAR